MIAASWQRLIENHQPAHPSLAVHHVGVEGLCHLAEARLLVGAMRPFVADGREERDARRTPLVEEMSCEQRDGL
jgi:hypothetical protein